MSQTTESASARFSTLEHWSSADLVAGILEGQFSAISAVQGASVALAEAIDQGAERLARGGPGLGVDHGEGGLGARDERLEVRGVVGPLGEERGLVLREDAPGGTQAGGEVVGLCR